MTNKELFKIWSKPDSVWTSWIRPTPFISINPNYLLSSCTKLILPKIIYLTDLDITKNSAIIVDLPNLESIQEGLSLSKLGFIPIPIYNGTIEQKNSMSTVDNTSIQIGLIQGAIELKDLQFSNTASPVFLLDSNRMNRFKMNVSVFDNSWDIYPQDLPSAEYFLKMGITKIIVRSFSIQKDLSKILYSFQQKGLEIFFTDGYDKPLKINIKK